MFPLVHPAALPTVIQNNPMRIKIKHLFFCMFAPKKENYTIAMEVNSVDHCISECIPTECLVRGGFMSSNSQCGIEQ
jgi:hypothetical protein